MYTGVRELLGPPSTGAGVIYAGGHLYDSGTYQEGGCAVIAHSGLFLHRHLGLCCNCTQKINMFKKNVGMFEK